MKQEEVKELKFCPYEVLKLDPKAKPGQSEINKAFRQLAKLYHPDKNPSPEARAIFERGKLASQVLLSEDLRRTYD